MKKTQSIKKVKSDSKSTEELMPLYRAVINIDFENADSNHYTSLQSALIQANWIWVNTSAFSIETADLAAIWRGIDIVARQCASIGKLSALTFNIQGAKIDFTTPRLPRGFKNHPNAMRSILAKPFPKAN